MTRRSSSAESVSILCLVIGLLVSPGFSRASIIQISQTREVSSFASISPHDGGGGLFDSQSRTSPDPGTFADSVRAHVEEEPGTYATGFATQASDIGAVSIQADGSFRASADVQGTATFAEAEGFCRLSYQFQLDSPTPYSLAGSLVAADNGQASTFLLQSGVGTVAYVTAANGTEPVYQQGMLDAGDYQFDVWTFGFGQASDTGDDHPASGSFSMGLTLADPAQAPGIAAGPAALVIRPNPARVGGVVLLENLSGPAREVTIFDASGRMVRTLGRPGNGTIWDLRDDGGLKVAPGLYLVRVGGIRAGKAVVLP